MDVAISELRNNLRAFVERARAGEDLLVTERGIPVARLTAVSGTDLLEQLTREGLVTRPQGRRRQAAGHRRVRSDGSISDLLGDLRR